MVCEEPKGLCCTSAPTLLQERNAILDGRTELTITTHIAGSPTTLVLTSSGHSVLFTSGIWQYI